MNDAITRVLDAIINPIVDFIAKIITFLISTRWSAILVWCIALNLIGFILMKKDKKYAKEDKRRIRESTLLVTAMAGGSLGIYAGMYKFNHKTLHKKFTIGVPLIILVQMAIISYGFFMTIFR